MSKLTIRVLRVSAPLASEVVALEGSSSQTRNGPSRPRRERHAPSLCAVFIDAIAAPFALADVDDSARPLAPRAFPERAINPGTE